MDIQRQQQEQHFLNNIIEQQGEQVKRQGKIVKKLAEHVEHQNQKVKRQKSKVLDLGIDV